MVKQTKVVASDKPKVQQKKVVRAVGKQTKTKNIKKSSKTRQDETLKTVKTIKKVQTKKDKSLRLLADKKPNDTTGVIYIGRLPYGWVEEGIREYFEQFGDVRGVKLYRSKKTNRTQGYGFVKFADKGVAKIAAQTMNGYLMFGKSMVSEVLDAKHPDPFKYKHGSQKLSFVNWQRKFIEEKNKDKTDEEIVKELKQLLKNEIERRNKLTEQGIKYNFIGFKELLA